MKGVCSCWLLTAVAWALPVHSIWIVVLVWQGNKTKDNSKLSLSSSKISYCQPQLAFASDSIELVSCPFLTLAISSYCRRFFVWKWTPQSTGSRLTHNQSRDFSEWQIFANPRLWLLKSMKDHFEQTKDPSITTRGREMLYFCHMLQNCFNTLSLSAEVQ